MKFLNKKRFASAALAGALALSMVTPAFASSKTTNITGTYNAITLSVAVPTTGKAIINPYGLPYTVGEGVTITGEKITTAAPLTVQNLSSVPLEVNVSITGTKTGGFEFETAASLGSSETGKKGVVKFEIFDALGVNATTIENTDALVEQFSKLKSADASGSVQITGQATPDTNTAGTPVVILREATSDGTLQAGGAAFFRLAGDVVKSPATSWAATDGFTAAIAFTFEPSATPYGKNAGTITATSGSLTAVDLTGPALVLTPALPTGLTATAQNTTWTVEDTENFTITPNASDPLKATVKSKASTASGATSKVTVTIKDANGIPYTASVDIAAA